jgi:hypothetical protein
MAVEPPQGCIPAPYRRRRPDKTVLYRVVQAHFETYLCRCGEGNWDGSAVPAHVEREFRRYLDCGILARGLLVPSLGLAPIPGG